MAILTNDRSAARRRLMMRDSLAFAALALVTAILFAFTFVSFRSFNAYRDQVGREWSARGREALASSRPSDAILSLRTAVTYGRDTRPDELLLAQALGDAGHTAESYSYFMSLREVEPGNGRINLELARLAAKNRDSEAAQGFYRAAIYGTWEGDGVQRRTEARLELARYLLAIDQPDAARRELLIVGGNLPANRDLDITLADLLQQAGDAPDVEIYRQRARTSNGSGADESPSMPDPGSPK